MFSLLLLQTGENMKEWIRGFRRFFLMAAIITCFFLSACKTVPLAMERKSEDATSWAANTTDFSRVEDKTAGSETAQGGALATPAVDTKIISQPESAVEKDAAGGRAGMESGHDVSSIKGKRFESEFSKKLEHADIEKYAQRLEVQGLEKVEPTAEAEKRIELPDKFLVQNRTRGNAIDLLLNFIFPFTARIDNPGGTDGYFIDRGSPVGGTVAWSFQLNNLISLGACIGMAPFFKESQRYDEADILYAEQGDWIFFAWLGPLVVIGDKVTSFAVQFSVGLGLAYDLAIPIRFGFYYRNFYAGYAGHYLLTYADDINIRMIHGVEAGYSIFLGKKRARL
jgi:hypothetical protein